MPQRQNIIQFNSTEVQGEGSWVKVRMVTHGQSKTIQRQWSDVIGVDVKDIPAERRAAFQDASDQLLVKAVVDWNWVNDDGDPLPLPNDDPAVIDDLTEVETLFLANAMRGEGERKK